MTGAAIGAPTASVKAEVLAFSTPTAGGAIAMAIAAVDRAYPGENLTQYLNDAGQRAIAANAHPLARIEDWQARPNVLDEPAPDAFLKSISPLSMPGRPDIPVFLYHDRTDEFAPIAPALQMVEKWFAAGTPAQIHVDPVGEHIAYQTLAAPLAMSYLADRFADKPVKTSCPTTLTAAPPAALAALRLARGALRVDRHRRVAPTTRPRPSRSSTCSATPSPESS